MEMIQTAVMDVLKHLTSRCVLQKKLGCSYFKKWDAQEIARVGKD